MISDRYSSDGIATLKLNQLQVEMKKQIEHKISSDHYQFEEADCPVCEGSSFQVLSEKDRYGLPCQNVVCVDCGLVMINPRWTEDAYNEFYDQEYRPLYTGKNANAANFFQGQLKRGERLFQYLDRKGHLPKSEKSLVLEIGCGAGGILSFFSKQGFVVRGIDLGSEYLNYGVEQHGLDLQIGTIHDIQLDAIPDLVIYSHVLEHIPDPNLELSRLRDIIDRDTLVYVEVPGIKNLSSGYRKDPLRYFQNAHTYSFSMTSLNNLFVRNGFSMVVADEFVKAIFKKHPDASSTYRNDYPEVLGYLQRMERERKNYAFSRARLRVIGKAAMEQLSNFTKA